MRHIFTHHAYTQSQLYFRELMTSSFIIAKRNLVPESGLAEGKPLNLPALPSEGVSATTPRDGIDKRIHGGYCIFNPAGGIRPAPAPELEMGDQRCWVAL